uniref:Ubiquitin-like protease family profile domain-containing protein n=1 Tax=Cajanus cajan TaxID=3821 RepID=A0A151R5D4_CAJCA|nr:hypothetical protein KK1_040967 [Cajanus cajan]
MNLKAKYRWSDKSFTELLKLLKLMLPKDNTLPNRHYEAKKVLCPMGLQYKKIHACPNDCILYRKEFETLQKCPRYGLSRYKVKDGGDNRNCDGMLRYPADSPQWKKIDYLFLDFGSEARNLRLGLALDGMNPFVNLSTNHSSWPVFLSIYNFPPCDTNIFKSKMFSSVATKFRQHKSYLTSEWVHGKHKGKSLCDEYNIDPEEWEKFMKFKMTLLRRKKAQDIQKLNDTPHLLSRGGYELLVRNFTKSEIKRLKEEAIQSGASEDVVIDPPRLPPCHMLWKMARTKTSSEMTSESANQIANVLEEQSSQGSFIPEGCQDIVNTALGRSEHPGRVRIARAGVTIASLFGVNDHDFKLYISFQYIYELIQREMLNISIIRLWMLYLNQKIEELGHGDLYRFFEPQTIQKSGNKKAESQNYINERIKTSPKQIYLAPYVDQNHWKILVLCPINNVAIWFCSLHRKPNVQFKNLMKR